MNTITLDLPTEPQTQRALIRKHLNERGSITAYEALLLYRVTRLAARILELRDSGLKIDSEWKHDLTGKRYVAYHLRSPRRV